MPSARTIGDDVAAMLVSQLRFQANQIRLLPIDQRREVSRCLHEMLERIDDDIDALDPRRSPKR
jgi:hypothetical protein